MNKNVPRRCGGVSWRDREPTGFEVGPDSDTVTIFATRASVAHADDVVSSGANSGATLYRKTMPRIALNCSI